MSLFYPHLLGGSTSCSTTFTPSVFDVTLFQKTKKNGKQSMVWSRADVEKAVMLVLTSSLSDCNIKLANAEALDIKSDLRRRRGVDNLVLVDAASTLARTFCMPPITQSDIDCHFDTPLDIVDFICQCKGIF